MKLVSWNVNGLRACMGKGFSEFLAAEDPDVICLQETKMQREQADFQFPGYREYWNSAAARKGYSGTALFTKEEPLSVTCGLGLEEADGEGRVIAAEYQDFFLVTVYTPNAQEGLARIGFRMEFEDAFREYLSRLRERKPVIACGDMNVGPPAHRSEKPQAQHRPRRVLLRGAGEVHGAAGHRHGGHLPALLPGPGGGILLVELPGQRQGQQHRVAHRLLPGGPTAVCPGWGDSRILAEVAGSDHCPVELLLEDERSGGPWHRWQAMRSVCNS